MSESGAKTARRRIRRSIWRRRRTGATIPEIANRQAWTGFGIVAVLRGSRELMPNDSASDPAPFVNSAAVLYVETMRHGIEQSLEICGYPEMGMSQKQMIQTCRRMRLEMSQRRMAASIPEVRRATPGYHNPGRAFRRGQA
jgi:hypothetical protein